MVIFKEILTKYSVSIISGNTVYWLRDNDVQDTNNNNIQVKGRFPGHVDIKITWDKNSDHIIHSANWVSVW